MKKLFIFVVTFIFGLQSTIVYAQNLKVDFTWQLKHSCSNVSPEIKVEDIPVGTVLLYISMRDLNRPGNNHGGGFVTNDSGFPNKYNVSEGALTNGYRGPCPTTPPHDYEFTVVARNKENKKIAEGEVKKPFPPK